MTERKARVIKYVPSVILSKSSLKKAQQVLVEKNIHLKDKLGEEAFREVINALASAEVEYNWETWMGAVFSYHKWREEWAHEFPEVLGLIDLEPTGSFIAEPVIHDHLVESAKAAIEKVAPEFHPKVLRFCHAITAAPKHEP